VEFDLTDARGAAIAVLAGAPVLALLPGHAGLPCPQRTLTGVPCPFCGSTTSVEDVFRGHLLGALGANPLGPAVVAAALFLVVRRPGHALRVPGMVVALAVLGLWLFELHRFSLI
jgi:Protein of unknown function (DUF2752)